MQDIMEGSRKRELGKKMEWNRKKKRGGDKRENDRDKKIRAIRSYNIHYLR